MAKITVNVFPADLSRELSMTLDTVSLEYFVFDLVAGMPTANLGHVIQALSKVYDERKEMEVE